MRCKSELLQNFDFDNQSNLNINDQPTDYIVSSINEKSK